MLVISLKKLDQNAIFLLKKIKQDFFLELRLDLINFSDIKKFKKDLPEKLIFTLKKDYSPLNKLLLLNPCYIDIEYDANIEIFKKIKESKVKIISSFHDYEKTPPLDEIFLKMQNPYIDCYKIATFASSSLDSLAMLEFVAKKAKQGHSICGICMGEKGKITRILSKVVGGSFTYAKITDPTAEGQIEFDILEKRYRYSSLNESTSIYALIGGNTALSVSDIVHNKVFALGEKNSVYVKIDLLKEELPLFFEKIKALPFKGFSVTMPLKEEVGKFLEPKTDLPINTLVKKNSFWSGFNTDGTGAMSALEKKIDPEGKKIIILGAGGAAKAIALEAIGRKSKVIILNRTKEKALLLAKEIGAQSGGIEEASLHFPYDIIINATASLDPLESEFFYEGAFAFDIHTRPQITEFLKKARLKNCPVIYGFAMFVYQAKEQQKLWSGI